MKLIPKKQSFQSEKSDILIYPLFEKNKRVDKSNIATLDSLLDGVINKLIKNKQLTGKKGSQLFIFSYGKLAFEWVLFIGLGDKESCSYDRIRHEAASAIRKVKSMGSKTVSMACQHLLDLDLNESKLSQAISEGATMGTYEYLNYKSYTC